MSLLKNNGDVNDHLFVSLPVFGKLSGDGDIIKDKIMEINMIFALCSYVIQSHELFYS